MTFDRRRFLDSVGLGFMAQAVTQVRAADEAKDNKVRTRSIKAEGRYLNFPVKTGAPLRPVTILVDGNAFLEVGIELADDAPDWWAFMDLQPLKRKTVTVAVTGLPDCSNALQSIHDSEQIEGYTHLYREARRPQFHFSSRRGWLNDPHVVFCDGEYHLFYQHNPYGLTWGNVHWGHAISTDLVHWKELPIALYPDVGCIMQSGTVVVDWNNTAGFRTGDKPTMVALFTARGRMILRNDRVIHENDIPATQGLAFSNDRGRTWTKYRNNPVIPHIIGENRDPHAFWYEPGKRWITALYMDKDGKSTAHDFSLFSSVDLKKWEKLSDVTLPGDIECPELFEMPVDGNPKNTRWIFHGVRGLYLIGKFNGETFTPESGPHKLQHGNCWHASQRFRDIPDVDGRCIHIAWGVAWSSGLYSGMPFNQAISIPVELTLRSTDEGFRLFSNPVEELASLRTKAHSVAPQILSPGENPLTHMRVELFELMTEMTPDEATEILFNLRGVCVTYNKKRRELSCGDTKAPLEMDDGKIRLRMLIDRTTIDIFGNDGRLFMPMGVVVPPDNNSVAVQVSGGNAQIHSLELFELKSAWGNETLDTSP